MTEITQQRTTTNLAEELAISLYLTEWPGRDLDDWLGTLPSIRSAHRQQAARLLEEGHLNKILLDHETNVRGRWVDTIRRTIPAAPAAEGSLQRQIHKAAVGAFESAATIVRGRPA